MGAGDGWAGQSGPIPPDVTSAGAAPMSPGPVAPGWADTGQIGVVDVREFPGPGYGASATSSMLGPDQPGREPPRSFMIPEADDASTRPNLYVIAGNVLGAALGILTATALIVSLVIAIRHEEPEPVYSASAGRPGSARSGGGNEGTMDYSTTGDSAAGGSATDSGTYTGGDTATAGAGGSGEAAASGGGGGEAGGGTTTPASGPFKFAPPEGKYPATGSGTRVNSPPGGAGAKVSNPSFEVKGVGGGCYDMKVIPEPGNFTTLTYCATTDGGVVQPKNVQWLRTVIVGNLAEENTATLICKPPALVLPANPAPGMTGDLGGNCIGSSSSNKVPGTYKQPGTYKIVGKETVAGVEAIHLRQDFKQMPNDAQNTQNGTMSQDIWFAPNGAIVRFVGVIDATSCVVSCSAINVKFHQDFDLTATSASPS